MATIVIIRLQTEKSIYFPLRTCGSLSIKENTQPLNAEQTVREY